MKNKIIAIGCLICIVFAIVFSFTFGEFTLGDEILNFLGLPAWSNGTNGTHYTIFYSLAMIAIALYFLLRKCNLKEFIKHKSQ